MPVKGSSPEWPMHPYLGSHTYSAMVGINNSLLAKPTSGYRQALTDNGCCAKEEDIHLIQLAFITFIIMRIIVD